MIHEPVVGASMSNSVSVFSILTYRKENDHVEFMLLPIIQSLYFSVMYLYLWICALKRRQSHVFFMQTFLVQFNVVHFITRVSGQLTSAAGNTDHIQTLFISM